MNAIDRRQFSQALAGVIAAAATGNAETENLWGGPVVDCHHHFRSTPEANIAHLDGCGVSNAMLLVRDSAAGGVKTFEEKFPGRVLGWFASTDITKPDAETALRKMVSSGAIGFGEIKFHVEAAGPELRRMYALAAELNVPILVHF